MFWDFNPPSGYFYLSHVLKEIYRVLFKEPAELIAEEKYYEGFCVNDDSYNFFYSFDYTAHTSNYAASIPYTQYKVLDLIEPSNISLFQRGEGTILSRVITPLVIHTQKLTFKIYANNQKPPESQRNFDRESIINREYKEVQKQLSYQNPLFKITHGLHFLNIIETRLILRRALLDNVLKSYVVYENSFNEIFNGVWVNDETWCWFLATGLLHQPTLSPSYTLNKPIFFKEEDIKDFITALQTQLNKISDENLPMNLVGNPELRKHHIKKALPKIIQAVNGDETFEVTRKNCAEKVNTFAIDNRWWKKDEIKLGTIEDDLTNLGWQNDIRLQFNQRKKFK